MLSRIKALPLALLLLISSSLSAAKFGETPPGWGDIKFGLVSNGVPYDANNSASFDTRRLKVATEELGIKIDYRYRYVNEGVDPYKNACVNLFNWKWDADYSKHAMRDAGVQSSYVIYVLQEEGGRIKLLENMKSPEKMQQFFHTLVTVAEHAKGYGATIVVEPDTWGYLMQDRYQTIENTSIEVDPTKIPAVVNNIDPITVRDSFWVIPDPEKPWEKTADFVEREISFDYLSDLPNNMAGFGRAMIRTLHKFAPDCYVGFLASHWSVNLGLSGQGWSSDGMVWATDALIDTSAKLNIEFFKKFYFGSIDDAHPWQPGDSPDFIGVEKNGWCAGTWEVHANDNRTYWYWGDEQMRNYLKWVKQIGQGLDLPVLGWQISIGNMDNPNTGDVDRMANAYKDTFFPYFFDHVDEFIDAGFIGFLVGKGLSQATDYVLPDENYGEKGWFFNKLKEFDKGRPYYDLVPVAVSDKQLNGGPSKGKLFLEERSGGYSLSFTEKYSAGQAVNMAIYNLRGQQISRVEAITGDELIMPTNLLAPGAYILKVAVGKDQYVRRISSLK